MPEIRVESRSTPQPASARALDRDNMDAIRASNKDESEERSAGAPGLYVGVTFSTSQPLGDFDDGDNALVGPTDQILIPELDVGAGVGAYVSYRWLRYELILQYEYSEYDGEASGSPLTHDTEIFCLDLNFRRYFWIRSPIQPYGLFGFGWTHAEIENAASDIPPTVVQTAELEDGINANLGIGVAFYPMKWLCLYGQAMYRFVRYGTSDGVGGTMSNIGDVDGDGWNLSFGGALRLLPGRDRD